MSNGECRILVVDDEDFNRSLLLRCLGKEGFENIETTDNGKQAMEMARAQGFDLGADHADLVRLA